MYFIIVEAMYIYWYVLVSMATLSIYNVCFYKLNDIMQYRRLL